jgi:hypothetical protein
MENYLTTALQAAQEYYIFKQSERQDNYLHKIELETAQMLHDFEIDMSRKSFLMQTFSELEKHFVQLDADLVTATKVIRSFHFH